jgi:hypothetical protein
VPGGQRDPLSVRYDRSARRALLAAIRAWRAGGKTATAWIASEPPSQFRNLDTGGRTGSERAFTRACYYQVFKIPRNLGVRPQWSLKLTWGPVERRGSRYGRTVTLRMFRYGSGYAKVAKNPRQSWILDDAKKARPMSGEVGDMSA